MHRRREGAVGNEPIDGRAAQAGSLDDGRQARKHACRHGRGLRCGGKSIHGSVCNTISRNARRGLAIATQRITAKNHHALSIPVAAIQTTPSRTSEGSRTANSEERRRGFAERPGPCAGSVARRAHEEALPSRHRRAGEILRRCGGASYTSPAHAKNQLACEPSSPNPRPAQLRRRRSHQKCYASTPRRRGRGGARRLGADA